MRWLILMQMVFFLVPEEIVFVQFSGFEHVLIDIVEFVFCLLIVPFDLFLVVQILIVDNFLFLSS
jgi:hypothetical protein